MAVRRVLLAAAAAAFLIVQAAEGAQDALLAAP